MGIFNKLFSKNESQKGQVGETGAKCPHCASELKKMPGAKTKCPSCGEFMYVRTRPSDRKRVVVTKEQAEEIEEQWAIENGTHDEYLDRKKEYEDEKSRLRVRFGAEPSEGDVKWGILNKDLIKHGANNDWGFYRNVRCEMAQILEREKRYVPALNTFFEVCYLDLNGPDNLGGYDKHALEHARFDPTSPSATLAPGIIGAIEILLKEQKLTREEAKEVFLTQARNIQKNLKLSVSPEDSWEKVNIELYQEEK